MARNPAQNVVGATKRCHGLAAGDPDALIESAHAYGNSPRRFDSALAYEDAAAALARGSRSDEARDCLSRALAIYDRLFLSRGTVRWHVSNILSKLGLTSRVELAAASARNVHAQTEEARAAR